MHARLVRQLSIYASTALIVSRGSHRAKSYEYPKHSRHTAKFTNEYSMPTKSTLHGLSATWRESLLDCKSRATPATTPHSVQQSCVSDSLWPHARNTKTQHKQRLVASHYSVQNASRGDDGFITIVEQKRHIHKQHDSSQAAERAPLGSPRRTRHETHTRTHTPKDTDWSTCPHEIPLQ